MRETKLSGQLVSVFREGIPGSVVFKHADQYTAGIPDISLTWWMHTSWWEVKLGGMIGTDLQHRTMIRLARTSLAYYVVYGNDFTRVIRPDNKEIVASSQVFADHPIVLNFAKGLHRA